MAQLLAVPTEKANKSFLHPPSLSVVLNKTKRKLSHASVPHMTGHMAEVSGLILNGVCGSMLTKAAQHLSLTQMLEVMKYWLKVMKVWNEIIVCLLNYILVGWFAFAPHRSTKQTCVSLCINSKLCGCYWVLPLFQTSNLNQGQTDYWLLDPFVWLLESVKVLCYFDSDAASCL